MNRTVEPAEPDGVRREAAGGDGSAGPSRGFPWIRSAGATPRDGLPGWSSPAAKRGLDIACALVGLVLTLPAWLIIPILIKLEDGGPVFFVQERVGRDGETFRLLKFRSMVPAEDRPRVPQQDVEDADLITRVGRFIRPTALDELPQLLVILRGDMSMVGPRAVPPEEKSARGGHAVEVQEVPGFQERHRVKPGLTGMAQLHLSRSASHRNKFRMDVLYVRTRTFWLDLKLILLSVWISLRGAWPEIGRDDR